MFEFDDNYEEDNEDIPFTDEDLTEDFDYDEEEE